MSTYLLVGIGAFLGGVTRYSLGVAITNRLPGQAFPWHTFAVNVLGCLLAGAVAGALSTRPGDDPWRLFLTTGFLGGMTTFSAFGLETIGLIRAGNVGTATMYVVASLVAGLLGVWLGTKLFGG